MTYGSAIKLYRDSRILCTGLSLKYKLRIKLQVDNYTYITNRGARCSKQHFNYESHYLRERSLGLANESRD